MYLFKHKNGNVYRIPAERVTTVLVEVYKCLTVEQTAGTLVARDLLEQGETVKYGNWTMSKEAPT